MKMTRRELAAELLTPIAAPAQAPPANPAEELKAAQEQIQESAEALDRFDLPMETEPATAFRA